MQSRSLRPSSLPPFANGRNGAPEPTHELTGPMAHDTVNILLVDDEVRNLEVLESILEGPGHRLIRATTSDEALLALVHHEFACIVLDIQMPTMNGIELAGLIKTRKRSQHIPIIFLTAYFQDEKDILEGYGVGAVDYLTKPLNPQILKSKVGVFVDLFRTARALTATNTALELEIAEREKAEEALRQANNELEARVEARTADVQESEKRYRTLMEQAHDGIVICDREGHFLNANKAGCQLLGYPLDELLHLRIQDTYVERGDELFAQRVEKIEKDNALRFERKLRRRDGNIIDAEFSVTSIPKGLFCGIMRDVTERKRTEEALAHLAAIVESSHDAIISKDLDGVIQSWNLGAERILGYRPDEVVGQHISKIIPMDRLEEEQGLLARLRRGEHIEHWHTSRLRKDGSEVPVSLMISPIKDPAGIVLGASSIARDITQQKMAEDALKEARDRLETRVQERTSELATANLKLRSQIREREQLEALVLSISEREQQRIGQDLHDGLCQYLTGIKFKSTLLEQKLVKRAVPEAAEARTIEVLLSQAIEQARHQARGLDPIRLEADGLVTALQELAASVSAVFRVKCDFVSEETLPVFDHAMAIHVYRIAQEAISNAIKHGRADGINLQLARQADNVQLTIRDNGAGFPRVPQKYSGAGLHIMNYRARTIGAALEIKPGDEGGTVVICSLPRDQLAAIKSE